MTKPEKKDVVTTIRLPVELHDEIKAAAHLAGHAMNVEIISRLRATPKGTSFADIARQNAKIQEMVQQIIDAISPRR